MDHDPGTVTVPHTLFEAMSEANHIVVMTGAGMSAESGIPTFREAQTGLWAQYDPMQLATPEAFADDPQLVWNWYEWRRSLVLSAAPHAGHDALVRLASIVPGLSLVTQNVDGLHQIAGSVGVVELHGSLLRAKCFEQEHLAEDWPTTDGDGPPSCPICGSLMRPNVVWFNESLPESAIQAASEAANRCDVFLSVGTSSVVYPAAGLATEAVNSGAFLAEINPDETPLSDRADVRMAAAASKALPEIVAAIK